jgi:hypothetical protein
MDIWQHAKKAIARQDLELARSLGFDSCQKCDEWFHLEEIGWVDCVGCGRHCQTCADQVEWEWCDKCGLHTCQECLGHSDRFVCQVCLIET